MDLIWINTEFAFPPVKEQADWTRLLHQKWFKPIVFFSYDLSLDSAVFSNFCLTLENYAETGYERAWKLQQEFYFQMIFNFMTRCSTSLTNCESRNVNSLDQSEGVHFFLIYQALFEQKDRDGGRSENLDWRVVIRCLWSAKIWEGRGEGAYSPSLPPLVLPSLKGILISHFTVRQPIWYNASKELLQKKRRE